MKNLISTFLKLGYDLKSLEANSADANATFLLIRNRDGSPRWVWPMHLRQPLFLECYNESGWRAKLYANLIRLVFFLRIQPLVFYKEFVQIAKAQDKAQGLNFEGQWAMFTGTPGPLQKSIFVVAEKCGISFLKLAVGSRAVASLMNESLALVHLEAKELKTIKIPQLQADGFGLVQLASVNSNGHRLAKLDIAHRKALLEIARATMRRMPLAQLPAWGQMTADLIALRRLSDPRIPQGLLRKLTLLADTFDPESHIIATMSHGDFTPWNMFVAREGLCLYDWEQWRPAMPLGFDAFHFVLQSETLMGRSNWTQIEKELDLQVREQFWPSLGAGTTIPYAQYFKLYLLLNIVDSLQRYSEQKVWHTQVSWLLDTWTLATSSVLAKAMPQRKLLLMDVFDWLQGKDYTSLKFPACFPEDLSIYSDVDLCIGSKDAKAFRQWLGHHPMVGEMHHRRQSFMAQSQLFTLDGSILSLDLIWDLRRKEIQMMDTRALIQTGELNRFGVKVPTTRDQARQIGLFYGLNGAAVPSRYTAYGACIGQSDERIDQLLFPYFEGESGSSPALIAQMRQQRTNRGIHGFLGKLYYGLDVLRSVVGRSGFLMTFSGVDGAGKSTVVAAVAQRLEKQLRQRVVVLRHRPSILPILSAWTKGKAKAEAEATEKLPRQGSNQSRLGSLLRFAYYFSDYLFGQLVIHFKYVRRGYIVIYDRYYFDFISDSRRSNIVMSSGITRWAYKLLMQPKLNFFLYAAPELILERKQELDQATIIQLTDNYLDLFHDLGQQRNAAVYLPIENVQLEQTLDAILTCTLNNVA